MERKTEAKDISKSILQDNDALVTFLNSIMEKSTHFITHSDSQVNILIGIGTAIAAVSMTSINGGHNLPVFYILGLFSTASVLVGLYAVHPPKKMRKKGQGESLFYNRNITQFDTAELYAEKLKELLADKEKLVENYSIEIYNLYKYYYRPKRDLFNISRKLLMGGIVLSVLLYAAELLQ